MAERTSIIEPLTSREADVLDCLTNGLSNNEIAEKLFLSPSTAKWYVRQLNSKLDTANRDEIVQRARTLGLVGTNKPELITAKHNLPYQTTPFIGRDTELDELERMLGNPDIRLVTILAPGGMGKTRLALEAAEQQVYNFPNGVFFIPLQPLVDVEQIVLTVAQQIGFPFRDDGRSLKQQLLDYFRGKQMLLLIDNWEHLLDGTPLIAEILQAAPNVKVLATSREKLNLSAETVYALRGMQFPTWETPEDALRYDAVKLLLQAARRVRPDFLVTAENLTYIARICRLTEGMPLGILLATSWLDALSLERIAEEIQKNVDFLETEMRDVPERQRSIRAVFESAYERLGSAEQQVFMKLSVFRGGCTPEAAEALTGAKLRTLQTLINKSFLLRSQTGRYDVHELLRQYGYEQLRASGNLVEILRSHSIYYADFLHQRDPDLKGGRQLEAAEEIEVELDNIRQSWYQALQNENVERIERSLFSLSRYLYFRSRKFEFITFYVDAEAALRSKYANHRDYGRLLAYYGLALEEFGRTQEAEPWLRQALAIAQMQDDSIGFAFSAMWLGVVLSKLKRATEQAEQLCDQSLHIIETLDDAFELAEALHLKSYLISDSGRNDESLAIDRQTLEIRRKLGDQFGMANSLNNIAAGAMLKGQWAEAEALGREALALVRHLKQPASIVRSLLALGLTEFQQGNLEACRQYTQEAFPIAQEIAYPYEMIRCLMVFVMLALVCDHFEEAEQKLEEALSLLESEIRSGYLLFKSFVRLGLGDCVGAATAQIEYLKKCAANPLEIPPESLLLMGFVLAEKGQVERGVELASLTLNHFQMTKAFANSPLVARHVEALKGKLTEEVYDAAWERGKLLDWKATVAELLEELTSS